MLDGWSVRLLLQAFYRAYLTGGVLPGGERRPDVRDHARWLDAQGSDAARQFWATRTAAGAVLPLAPDPTRRGSGRARRRLTPYEAVRLRGWAAAWGRARAAPSRPPGHCCSTARRSPASTDRPGRCGSASR